MSSNQPQPLFSVVSVTLNPGEALRATADSVDAQSFERYEHIVKDGGSVDGSVDALPAHARRRVIRTSDRGIYDGMNQALQACRGEWVLFLNAGDLLLGAHALAQIAASIEGSDLIDLAYCDRRDLESGVDLPSPPDLSRFFLFRNTLCHQVCFVRTRCFEKVGGFDTSLRIAADQDFLDRAVLREHVASRHVPVVAIGYRGGGYSTLAANRRRLKEEGRLVRARYFSPAQRFRYRCVLFLTLPELRIALNSRFPRFRAWYSRVLGLINRASRLFRPCSRTG